MYKCGWNGCEKAYGTLNHLNAHVTSQSHGQKRTTEGISIYSSGHNCAEVHILIDPRYANKMLETEFKEVRREWNARERRD